MSPGKLAGWVLTAAIFMIPVAAVIIAVVTR